ncbi:MAG: hypothetical protein J6B24_01600 [Clostridia bacterium]|nr:hypothetical protein [Clostridia bacterium]
MPLRKRKEPCDRQRYARGSTKKRARIKIGVRPWQIMVPILCALGGIVLALVWGNHLKAQSDAYREEQSKHDWTLDGDMAPAAPVEVPDIRAVEIKPEGNVGDILIAGKHGGVILPLCDSQGTPLYASAVGAEAGLPIAADAPSLTEDVARISKRGLNVTCVYTLTCFTATDPSVATYRRGLDLALLREFAEARPDDILLLGLPAGNDAADRRAVEFLNELDALLADLPSRPAIGAALPPSAFATEEPTADTAAAEDGEATTQAPLYAGNISPARILAACDYLAMDLRSMSAVGVDTLLPHIQFAYVRHSLRLLVNINDRDGVERVLDRGFERVFEMEPPPVAEIPEDTGEDE